jgi:hypothetical protein
MAMANPMRKPLSWKKYLEMSWPAKLWLWTQAMPC